MKNDQSNEQREGGDQFKRCIERKCLRKEYLFMIDNSHANVAEKKQYHIEIISLILYMMPQLNVG